QEVVPALGHAIVEDAAVAPTCTETGLTAGSHCTRCDDATVAQEVVEALGHDYVAVVTAPTCTEGGYTTYSCSRCDSTYTADETEALGHAWGEWTVTVPSTCTQTGIETRVCANDASHVETRELALSAHTAGETTVEVIEGVEKYVTRCTVCGNIISVEDIPTADYTALNAAVAKANALDSNIYYDFTEVTAALNAVVSGLNETHQDEVDAMTASINEAIGNLKTIVSLMTVNRATVKQSDDTITIMINEGAANAALSTTLKNSDTITITDPVNLTVSKDGRYVAKSNATATMTLKDGRVYNLVFRTFALEFTAADLKTMMVDTETIVVDHDARTISMVSLDNRPYVVIYNTLGGIKNGTPVSIENAELYTTYRWKITKPASQIFESTITIKDIEYKLTVVFAPFFEAEASGLKTMFVKTDTIQIDNDARTISMHSNNNATYAVIYNYYGDSPKSGKALTIDDAELYTTYRWKMVKPEGGVYESTLYIDGIPYALTIIFDEAITKDDITYEIVDSSIIIRSVSAEKSEVRIPATMIIGGQTYNVIVGKVVLEKAADGYMDPVSGVFYNNKTITKVIFEDGVTIEDGDAQYMFAGSTVQEVYNIPDGTTDMYACFYNCTSLTTVDEIPESVTSLGYAFNKCRALTGELVINAAEVTDITRNTFRYAGQYNGLTIYATGKTYKDIAANGSLGANVSLVEF
ncbi:MAG: leucine-rich repeat protein, partial [Clostridia bacterium]|nr:leucine-rich repeat protein [Clostridia bacterium]